MVGHAGEGLRTLTGAGAGTCSCGTYNLGAIAGGRLAVLKMGLGDHLGSRDLAALERSLVDATLGLRTSVEPAPIALHYPRIDGDAPEGAAGSGGVAEAALTASGWTGTSYEWPKGEPR